MHLTTKYKIRNMIIDEIIKAFHIYKDNLHSDYGEKLDGYKRDVDILHDMLSDFDKSASILLEEREKRGYPIYKETLNKTTN